MGMMYNFHQQLNSQVNIFPPEEMELLHQASHDNYFLTETCFDPLYGLNNNLFFFSEDNYASPLPYLLNPCDDQLEYYYPFDPDQFPQEDFECFGHQKRRKTYEDNYYSDPHKPIFFDRIVSNPDLFQDFTLPEVMVPFCDFPSAPPVYSTSSACTACTVKKAPPQTAERTLSAQSIAARQRRRKITEKTQELGKLVPGGQKMNTAEMFQAAFKYIKYLQAQVAVLESMRSFEGQEHHSQEDLQALVASCLVQEKLYSTEKCLVPTNLIEALADDQEIQSNPPVLNELRHLIRTCV